MRRACVLLFAVVACYGSGSSTNPLHCTTTQACYDCLKMNCMAELAAAETACKDFLDCRQMSCSDKSCDAKVTQDCNNANSGLRTCELPKCTSCL